MPFYFENSLRRHKSAATEVGVACFVFYIHTEMDAIFQPIKKSDTYQIKL